MRAGGTVSAIGILMLLVPAVSHADPAEDVRAAVVRQAAAWNQHDAAAYAALFTARCDVVNVVGWWWKGRAELQQKLTPMFASVFQDSRLTFINVHVRFLTADLAVGHAEWTMTGARMPPGIPEPGQGIQTLVLKREPGGRLIDVFQNTNKLPEPPIPAPAAASPN